MRTSRLTEEQIRYAVRGRRRGSACSAGVSDKERTQVATNGACRARRKE